MSADPLSDIICLLSIEQASWARLEASGDWALRFEPTKMMKFVKVERGNCCVVPEGGEPIYLAANDMLMFLNSPAYVVASAPHVPPPDQTSFFSAQAIGLPI